MTKEEINECKFINETMRFYTYADFVRDARSIKEMYKNLKLKTMYKWYVYANINMSMLQKNVVWEYLNGSDLMNLKKYLKGGRNGQNSIRGTEQNVIERTY